MRESSCSLPNSPDEVLKRQRQVSDGGVKIEQAVDANLQYGSVLPLWRFQYSLGSSGVTLQSRSGTIRT